MSVMKKNNSIKTMVKTSISVVILIVLLFSFWFFKPWQNHRYNVVFISVDDMNNWVSILKNYPGIQTPNLERLAKHGANFIEAHTASPVCNPSRFSTLTGLLPSTTGIYDRKTPTKKLVKEKKYKFVMDYFKEAGYLTVGIGKILHTGLNRAYKWDKYHKFTINKQVKRMNGISDITDAFFDWGEFVGKEEDIDDVKMVNLAKNFLEQVHLRPFFLAVGIHNPHLPWVVPSRFFDMYPIEKIQLTNYEGDNSDLPSAAQEFINIQDDKALANVENKKETIRAYLAALSFTDELLGRLLDSLEKSRYADNTIIVFWSDHGLHLGEKNHWRKSTLWRESTHIPFIISTPETRKNAGLIVSEPVSLLDTTPTLLDLCNINFRSSSFDGISLTPLINKKPGTVWSHPAISIMNPGNYSVHFQNWHYVLYANGDQELYDLNSDMEDRYNLAQTKDYQQILNMFRKLLGYPDSF
jgi:arylsulfatase A-like enzyme